jgi:aminopeptidase
MHVRTAAAALCLALGLGFGAQAAAQKGKAPKGPDTKAIAAQLVNQVAGVKEGEIVLLSGDVRDADLLEDLAVEVRKHGAFPVTLMGREKSHVRFFDEVPAKYDGQTPQQLLKLWQIPSVQIGVQGQEFPALYKHVPPARIMASDKAWEPVAQLILKRGVRRVFLGNGLYPTTATAKQFGMSKDQLAKLFWDGVAVEPARIQAAAEAVRSVLAKGQEVRVTNPTGTDLKFRIQARPILVSDGIITDAKRKKGGAAAWTYFPAGEVMTTPVPGTAEGKVVVERVVYEDGEILGLTVTFKAGKVVGLTAKPSPQFDRLKATYDAATGRKDEFGAIDFGVNPGVKIPKGSKLLTWVAAGTITVGIGWNGEFGGDNTIQFSSYWHHPGCTVTVDGKPLVEKGELKVPGAGVAAK